MQDLVGQPGRSSPPTWAGPGACAADPAPGAACYLGARPHDRLADAHPACRYPEGGDPLACPQGGRGSHGRPLPLAAPPRSSMGGRGFFLPTVVGWRRPTLIPAPQAKRPPSCAKARRSPALTALDVGRLRLALGTLRGSSNAPGRPPPPRPGGAASTGHRLCHPALGVTAGAGAAAPSPAQAKRVGGRQPAGRWPPPPSGWPPPASGICAQGAWPPYAR